MVGNIAEKETLTTPAMFRNWLRASLVLTKSNPTSFGVKNGLGRNTVSHFLRNLNSDIRLGNAQKLYKSITEEAARQGVDLPNLAGQLDA